MNMNLLFENLNKFFESVKSLGFWQRLFGWGKIKTLSYDAYEEFKALLSQLKFLDETVSDSRHKIELLEKDTSRISQLENENDNLKKDIGHKTEEITKLKETVSSLDTNVTKTKEQLGTKEAEFNVLKANFDNLTAENKTLRDENTKYKQTEETRKTEYDRSITKLNSLKDMLEKNENERQKEREKEITDRFEQMKKIWSAHETDVENLIKGICKKNTIEYIDKEKVPFKGKPDNTISIANEYIIFDAKSPANDNLDNFSSYIKAQTESVKKYAKEENVKKDIFLVIPSNTVDVINQFAYNMADYNVYIVTIDSLEAIILSLKKIENYEFAEKLSPEERDNICRVIGKFAHTTKRKIQIDMFFTEEFLSLLSKTKNDLPRDIMEKVIEFEKAEKINPPVEKRVKSILTSDLEKDAKKIQKEAEAKDIIFTPLAQEIKQLPLTNNEEDNQQELK
jgi:hypothetical protein